MLLVCFIYYKSKPKGAGIMNYIITGKNIEVTKALQEKVIAKLNKLEKFFSAETEARVTLSVEKLSHIVEVTIPTRGRLLRAEVERQDMYSAIDEIVDILQRQLHKYKNRLKDKARKNATNSKEELSANILFETVEDPKEETSVKIEKVKRFDLKPMDSEEAVLEMELIGHSFFVFRNGETDEVNVVYKRKNGTYGLIEPEY